MYFGANNPKKTNNNLHTLKLRRLYLQEEYNEPKKSKTRCCGSNFDIFKKNTGLADLFADALEVTEEAVQQSHKIDSFEVTVALEIVSHCTPGLRVSHPTSTEAPDQFCATKYFFHCWKNVLQVSSAANFWK